MSKKKPEDEMRPEYDFEDGIRGKYAQRYQEGSNVVLLDPDVANRGVGVVAVELESERSRARERPQPSPHYLRRPVADGDA